MSKRPYLQFYPTDWLGDIKLKAASLEEKGFYIDLLCLLHQSPKYGYITSEILETLPQLFGKNRQTISRLLAKILERNLLKTDEKTGEFFNNRMVRDEAKRKQKEANGKLGGRPVLGNQEVNRDTRNSKKLHIPESIVPENQNPEEISKKIFDKKEKVKKEIDGETFRGKSIQFDNFLDYCQKKKICAGIYPKSFFDIEDQFRTKTNWWEEVKRCVDWCLDNDVKEISAGQLRNWLQNRVKWAKEAEIKKKQKYQDKKFVHKMVIPPPVTAPIEEMDDLREEENWEPCHDFVSFGEIKDTS